MKPLIDKILAIRKQAGKGGWSYVLISGIPAREKNKQGLVRVKGWVDDQPIRQFNLLPLKDGRLMLPLKATLRKALGKKEGDRVRVRLCRDQSKVKIPEEIYDSLLQSEAAWKFFNTLSESNKKYYVDWVEESRTVDTRVNRIVKMISQLERKQKFWDWPARNGG